MKLKEFSLFLGSLLLAGCCAATQEQVSVKESKTTFAADALKPFVESGALPGAISILSKGDVQETACVGWADTAKKQPVTLKSTYMQCSQTKGFCGVTVAILAEEGKLSLDDPVSKYLPEFKNLKVAVKGKDGKVKNVPAKNVLTIRMVMNHTGGFPFETATKNKKGWNRASLRDSAREAAAAPLRFEPGTRVLYSNTGIDIGAAVVEVITGKSWDVFLKERVLDPLGMVDTTFRPNAEQLSRAIVLHGVSKNRKPKFISFNRWMPLPHNGADVHPSAGAGLWTTAADQVKFYRMLMNLGKGDNGVRILKEETVKKLLATSTRPGKFGGYSMGLAANFKAGTMGHGGAWGTRCTVNWRQKQLQLWVVQLNGSPRPWDAAWRKAVNNFFAAKVSDKGTDAYTGRLK